MKFKTQSNRSAIAKKVIEATMESPRHRLQPDHPLYDAWMFTSRWQADISVWDEAMVEFARKCVKQQMDTFYNTWTNED